MQKRIELLEKENAELKRRLKDVASIKGQRDVQEYMQKNDVGHKKTHDIDIKFIAIKKRYTASSAEVNKLIELI